MENIVKCANKTLSHFFFKLLKYMVSSGFVLIIKLILFFSIVIGFSIYNAASIKKQNNKKLNNFPPWHSDCPDNWVKVANQCKNPETGELVSFNKLTSNMTEEEKKDFLCLWTKDNQVSWIGIDNSC